MAITNEFRDHLDVCKQCRDNPFLLCDVGADILINSAKPVIIDSVTAVDQMLFNRQVKIAESIKKIEGKTLANDPARFLTKKQKWRQYKNKMKNKAGNKFHTT